MSTGLIHSAAFAAIPDELKEEYVRQLQALQAEIRAVSGAEELHRTLIERYAFTYCCLRNMETDFLNIDWQRYNQLTGLWVKIGTDLIGKYKELFKNGAANELVVAKIMAVIADEVDDDQLKRIRARLAHMAASGP